MMILLQSKLSPIRTQFSGESNLVAFYMQTVIVNVLLNHFKVFDHLVTELEQKWRKCTDYQIQDNTFSGIESVLIRR